MKAIFVMTKRAVALLLVLLMLVATMSCGAGNEPVNTDASTSETERSVVSETEAPYVPHFEQKNYNCDFNVICQVSPREYFFSEEGKTDALEGSVHERNIRIRDYLGVTCVMQDAGTWTEYAGNVSRTVQSGDDAYQLVLSHTYQGLVSLITTNCAYDFNDLEAADLDASYWRRDIMEELAVQDRYYLGYGDLCLSDIYTILFNKDLQSAYQIPDLYEMVRGKTWTLDKFIQIASEVSEDNGDGKWTSEDTYGISGWGWQDLISFMTASDIRIASRDAEGNVAIDYEAQMEKTKTVIDKVYGMYQADYSYFWKSDYGQSKIVPFESVPTLFQLHVLHFMDKLRGSEVPFGILPYPLYDENQEEYQSLSWNGQMLIPSSIKNSEMVGEVVELLNGYADPVTYAFYELLLGAKLSDAPDDAEMLKILWKSQVSDIGLVYCNSSTQMDALVFMLPKMCENENANVASYLRTYTAPALKGLGEVFNMKAKN